MKLPTAWPHGRHHGRMAAVMAAIMAAIMAAWPRGRMVARPHGRMDPLRTTPTASPLSERARLHTPCQAVPSTHAKPYPVALPATRPQAGVGADGLTPGTHV
jgi:hypothetical protein